MAYKYDGFWRAMDTLRDRQVLEEMVERGDTPWRPQRPDAAAEWIHEGAADRRAAAIGCPSCVWAPIRMISRSAPARRFSA